MKVNSHINVKNIFDQMLNLIRFLLKLRFRKKSPMRNIKQLEKQLQHTKLRAARELRTNRQKSNR